LWNIYTAIDLSYSRQRKTNPKAKLKTGSVRPVVEIIYFDERVAVCKGILKVFKSTFPKAVAKA